MVSWSIVDLLGMNPACSQRLLLLVAGSAWQSKRQVKSLPGMESSVIPLCLLQVSWSPFHFQKGRMMPRLQSSGSVSLSLFPVMDSLTGEPRVCNAEVLQR